MMTTTNRKILMAVFWLFLFAYLEMSSCGPAMGSRRNSLSKVKKSKRSWKSFHVSSPVTASMKSDPDYADSDVSSQADEFKPGLNKQWLELEGIPPSRVSVRLHSDLTLECQAVGSPPPLIFWLKNGKPLDYVEPYSAEEMSNQVEREVGGTLPYSISIKKGFVMAKTKSKLPLRCIRPEDEGQYTCVADNEGRQVVASTVVAIEEDDPSGGMRPECEYKLAMFGYSSKKTKKGTPAYILSSETLHMESIGSDVVLPCRGSGRPWPKMTWIDAEGQRIIPGKKFQVNANGNLLIRNLSWNEMGEYSCLAENSFGNDLASTFLYPLMTEGS